MDAKPIVHIVDDDIGVRDSLRFLLETAGLAVQTYASAEALLAATLCPAGCVLTDLRMPGLDGLQLQSALAARGVRLPAVIMTGHGEVPLAVQAMRGGAVDFIQKPFTDEQVLDCVRRALEQNAKSRQGEAVAADAARLIAQLTPREHEVLDLLVAGKSNKEIAQALGTSPRTIDVHRARVYQKLQADSLPDLVMRVLASRSAPTP